MGAATVNALPVHAVDLEEEEEEEEEFEHWMRVSGGIGQSRDARTKLRHTLPRP